MRANLFIEHEDVKTKDYNLIMDPGKLNEQVGEIAIGDEEHVNTAVKAAQRAFHSWKNVALEKRMEMLLVGADKLEEDTEKLATLLSRENGMPLRTTKAEIGMAIAGIKNLVEISASVFNSQQMEDSTGWVQIEKVPKGVIAGIVPWNAPVVLSIQKLIPAVLSGNTIVIKPSPFAAIGTTEVIKHLAECLPPGVVSIVHGDGKVGAALTSHSLVRKVSFTGGGPTAKHIMKGVADSLKDVHFELGGNDPAILLDDINVNEVVPQLVSSVFRRSGQYCFAIKRIYVPAAHYEDVYEKMVEAVDKLIIGYQLDEEVDMGPVNNRQQYENIKQIMEQTSKTNAQMIRLGKQKEPENWENGYYLRPTIVRDVLPQQEIVTREQFGPVIPLVPYHSEEAAINMANDSEYGLASSVWAADTEKAVNIAKQIEAGMTFINGNGQTPLGYKYMPFGGVKQSGIGRENAEVVFDEYLDTHSINIHK